MPRPRSYWQREREARQKRTAPSDSDRRAKRVAGQEVSKEFKPINRGQHDVWCSEADTIAAISGHGGGKSQIGAYWLMREIKDHEGDTFIVAGPTYNTLEKSSIPKIKAILSLWGLPWDYDQTQKVGYRVQQKQYMLPKGGIIYFASCDKPGSMQGTHASAFWMDETVDTEYYAFETLIGRVALNGGRGIITSTPYDMGWLYGQVYQPWVNAGRPDYKTAKDVFVAQWKSIDNKMFSKKSYERLKAKLEPWRFRLLYEGQFERPMGLVYDCFKPDTWIKPFKIPEEWPRVLGVDFGIVDPTACVWMAQAPDGTWIAYDEYYQSGWMRFADEDDEGSEKGKHSTQMEMINEIVAKCIAEGIKPRAVYCDDSGKDYIMQTAEMFYDNLGTRAVWPAHKKDISSGIQRCYGLVRTGKFKIFNTLQHFRDEQESYSYDIDKDTGEIVKGAPKDKNNHLMDAWRYSVVGSPDEKHNSFGFGSVG